LISFGWDERVTEFLDGPTVVNEIEELGMHRSPIAMRVAEMPMPPEETVSWAEYLLPAGFCDGIGVSLFSSDGRNVGFLSLLTRRRAAPSDEIKELLIGLAPILTQAIDPVRSLAAAARLVRDATAGVLLTHSGDVAPIPGLPAHQLLTSGSSVVKAALQMSPRAHASFLVPYPYTADRYLRITVLEVPAEASASYTAILTISPCGDLKALTRRELEILGLMIAGWPNLRIARSMRMPERTVASQVDHILVKLATHCRALAVVRAQRDGLYIPTQLAGILPGEWPSP
jgi:DNA-binding CsgD family transcriptional regulator